MMAELVTVLSFIQAAGIVVGVAYYILNIRISQRNQELMLKAQQQTLETRQAQMFMNVYQTVMSKEFQRDSEEILHNWKWKDMDDFYDKYGSIQEHALSAYVTRTYDGIGTLVRSGLVDPELVYDLTYVMVVEMWEKMGPMMREFRQRYNAPQVYQDFEYLHDVLVEIRGRRGHPASDLKEQIRLKG
jgi:hypothetical protein